MSHWDWSSIPGALPYLLTGAGVTLRIVGTAMIVGLAWGSMLAIMRTIGPRWLAWLAAAYVNAFRSVPLVMVILWFYLIVPSLLKSVFGNAIQDIRLASALTAFALFESAYYSEIIRAGIQSVAAGQYGAAIALGLRPMQAMRYVILPQAVRNLLPLLLTQAVVLFQDSSLVYVIGLADFFGAAQKVGERDGRLTELLVFAGAAYFLMSLLMSQGVRLLTSRKARA